MRWFEWGDCLSIGFGTTVAMWTVGYIVRLPAIELMPKYLLFLFFILMLMGGFYGGRYSALKWRSGFVIGLITFVLNLLILGSLISGENPNQIVPSALLWIPGSLVFFVLTALVGSTLGGFWSVQDVDVCNWQEVFANVMVAATLLLLVAGGLVTSFQEGLSVPDWPNSYGYNMFLYPLSKMSGGIYYEHAHRLLGSLVGLTTLVFAIHLQRVESRRWLNYLVWFAFVLVCIQGILGGLRVTGKFTFSDSFDDMSPSLTLAVVHGVVGQTFFALAIAVAIFCSTRWQRVHHQLKCESANFDRVLNAVIIGVLIIQLVIGAILRHMSSLLLVHVSMATFVLLFVIFSGMRAWGLYPQIPILNRLGLTYIGLTILQLIVGFVALYATVTSAEGANPTLLDVVVTTIHQIIGALLLGCSVLMTLWCFKLLIPIEGECYYCVS